MAFTLSFDAGDDAQIQGKCFKKVSTLTTGTPNLAGAEYRFDNCTQCVGVNVANPPNNTTVSPTACGTPFYRTETYNALQNWQRVNGARRDGVVPDILVRVTALPGAVPEGKSRDVDWCGHTWNMPNDSGVTYRACAASARTQHNTTGNITTTYPLVFGTAPFYGDDTIGRVNVQFGVPGLVLIRNRKEPNYGTTALTNMAHGAGAQVDQKAIGFAAVNDGGMDAFVQFGPNAKLPGGAAGGGDFITTDNSHRARGFMAATRWHRPDQGTNLLKLRNAWTSPLIALAPSGTVIPNINSGAKMPLSWVTHSSKCKGYESFLFEWFEGNNWAAWNAGL